MGWCRTSSTNIGSTPLNSCRSREKHGPRIEAEAKRLSAHHDGPVIAAGSTGSMPATARFLQAVAVLAQGAVVLPGLDTDLDEAAWQLIGGVRNAQDEF